MAVAKELNLVDSSGWIEYFTDGPNGGIFADPLSESSGGAAPARGRRCASRRRDPLSDASRLVVPTVSLYEVFRVVLRQRGEDDARGGTPRKRRDGNIATPYGVATMCTMWRRGRASAIPLSSALALEAARLAHDPG